MPKKTRLHLTLSPQILRELEQFASEDERSLSDSAGILIRDGLRLHSQCGIKTLRQRFGNVVSIAEARAKLAAGE